MEDVPLAEHRFKRVVGLDTRKGVSRDRIFSETEYSWIACQLEVGTPIKTFAVEVEFQIRNQFWILQLKLHR